MAQPLKDSLDASAVRALARSLKQVHPAFPERRFVADAAKGLQTLELTPRARHIADALQRHLPGPFAEAARILTASLGPETGDPEGEAGPGPLFYFPHVFWVGAAGLHPDDFEAAMAFQNAITRRFTAEFSIRAYLVAHPERTYRQLERWVSDPNVHVRRLVSEGTRPRLPWAPRLTSYVRDPNPVLALLERLRDDPELYVRRSVANNLNDIGKDHPDLLIEVATRWNVGAGEERRHLIRHALRSLVKAGDARALALLGFGGSPQVKIEAPLLSPRRLSLGQTLAFGCDLISTSQRVQSLNADWIVHFVKRSGKTSPKVWKGRRLTLSPGERIRLASKIALVDLTTRKHHAGIHRIELLLNGVVFPIGEADVIAPRVTGQKDEGLRATVRQAAAPRRP